MLSADFAERVLAPTASAYPSIPSTQNIQAAGSIRQAKRNGFNQRRFDRDARSRQPVLEKPSHGGISSKYSTDDAGEKTHIVPIVFLPIGVCGKFVEKQVRQSASATLLNVSITPYFLVEATITRAAASSSNTRMDPSYLLDRVRAFAARRERLPEHTQYSPLAEVRGGPTVTIVPIHHPSVSS